MPVSVRTFASSGEAAAALSADRGARYLGGGTLVMRALNEGDISISTVVRASDHALTRIDAAGPRVTIGAGVDLCAHPGRARSRLPARPCPLDRRTGGAQHGHRGRQSVRAKSVWRFHGRPARARRGGFRAGWPWQPRCADRGIPAIARAAGRHPRALDLMPEARATPKRSAIARSPASSRKAARSSRLPRICQ